MSTPWRGLDAEQVQMLKDYVEQLGPYLMVGFSTVARNDNTLQWDSVNQALKGHLRTAILMGIKQTMDKLRKVPSLQGKITGTIRD